MVRFPRFAFFFLALACLGASCPSPPPPGDTTIGSFAFTSGLESDPCGAANPDAGPITFGATLTGDHSTGTTYLSRGTAVETGLAVSTGGSTPEFTVCGAAGRFSGSCSMTESIYGQIYSAAEASQLGGTCPDAGSAQPLLDCDAFLDGGAPDAAGSLPGVDGGVSTLVCGQVVDAISCIGPCPWDGGNVDDGGNCSCKVIYSLSGIRQ